MSATLEATGIGVRYGAVAALSDVDINLQAGRVTGMIGPNGAGKSTLIDALMGFVPLASGRVYLDGVDLAGMPPHRRVSSGMTRTFQSVELFEDLSVAENLTVAAAEGRPSSYGSLSYELQQLANTMAGQLSPSRQKTVALGRALATGPRVLLLDEPAAGLDPDERQRLIDTIRSIAASGVAVMLVDHDLALVMDACDEVVVLDLGRVVAAGAPEAVRDNPRVTSVYLGDSQTTRAAAPHRASVSPPSLDVHGLHAAYNGRIAVRDVTLRVDPGELVTLLGPNGAGKTTTLLAVAGALRDVHGQGSVLGKPLGTRAHRLARAGVAQVSRTATVFGSLTAAENLRLSTSSARGISAALDLFPSLRPLLSRRAGALSGGEQQILALARALARQPRLLLVDELSLGLAPTAVTALFDVLTRLSRETGLAVLFAEQHAGRALAVADRAYVLAAGSVVIEGNSEDVAADADRLEAAYLGVHDRRQ